MSKRGLPTSPQVCRAGDHVTCERASERASDVRALEIRRKDEEGPKERPVSPDRLSARLLSLSPATSRVHKLKRDWLQSQSSQLILQKMHTLNLKASGGMNYKSVHFIRCM